MDTNSTILWIYGLFLIAIVFISAFSSSYIIQLVIGIIIALFFFILIIYISYYSYFANDGNNKIIQGTENQETQELSDNKENEISKKKIDELPEEDDLINSNLNITENEPNDNSNGNNKQINNYSFDDFEKEIATTQFRSDFLKSWKLSLINKKKKYNELLKLKTKELSVLGRDDSNNLFQQSSTPSPAESAKLFINRAKQIIERINHLLEKESTPEHNDKRLNSLMWNKDFGLKNIIGRNDVKNLIAGRIKAFSNNPDIFFSSFQHIILYGNPGLGKTRCAQTIAHAYACCGLLLEETVIETTPADFTTAYVKESAKLTHKLMTKGLECAIFIDEVYNFSGGKSMFEFGSIHKHGEEAINQMVNDLDKYMGLNVVIVAGYKDDVNKCFLEINKGLDRRFPSSLRLELKSYSSSELTLILISRLNSINNKSINYDEYNYIYSLISHMNDKNWFPNQAGDIINLATEIENTMATTNDISYKEGVLYGINRFLKPKNIQLNVEE